MEKQEKGLAIILSILFSIWFFAILIADVPVTNAAFNQTVLTKVNVSNTEPRIYNVTIDPTTTLNPGTMTLVICNATIWDYNGAGDVNSTNATFFFTPSGINGPIKNDTKYTTGCENVTALSSTAALWSCNISVWYFAVNGTWTCNMTAIDKGKLNATGENTTIILPLVAINVSDVIDYGIIPALNTSDDREANISNFGNVPLNISVRGWGGQNESLYANLSMICEYGNISIDYERFNTTPNTPWSNMRNLTDSDQLLPGLRVNSRNDTDLKINKTYWKLKVPSGVGGLCNGTILFIASNAV